MLNTAYSPYWLALFLLLGLAYAYLLYSKKGTPWQPIWNKILFVLRALAVSLIAYLLLEPFFNFQQTESENSNIVFLWDDSESLKKSEKNLQDYFDSIKELKIELENEKGVSVPIISLSGNDLTDIDSVENDRKASPLNEAIKNVADKVDKNLISEVVLFSDGIYNKGISPDYYAFPFQLSTVGLGDTTKKRDIVLQKIRYNKVAYEGNKFPIEVDITQFGFSSESVTVNLKKGENQISQKVVRFENNDELKTLQFLVEANSTGFQDYKVEIQPKKSEFNPNNNSKNAYVSVVEGKKSIILLAPYPHPDIKALAASINQNDNYEFQMVISGIEKKPIEKIEAYDLAILFHLPNNSNVFRKEIDILTKSKTPIWFINGPNLNYGIHNKLNRTVDLRPSAEKDEAFAYFNSEFDLFELNSEDKEIQEKLPPVFMPFVEHQFHPLSKALMLKRVGKVKTQQPVFVFYNDNETRQATLLLQDFRIWRMVEFLNTQAFDLFDAWVMKTVRYLTADNIKDRFEAFPVKEAFADNEIVKFQVEIYNEVFDRIYGLPVRLDITTEDVEKLDFEFTPNRLKPNFEAGNLKGGVYEYTAKVNIQGRDFESKGQFVVDQFDIESQNLQADFNLMRRVANKNSGNFFKSDQIDELRSYLFSKDYPKVLSSKSEVIPITQNVCPYVLILILIFSEWFIRRFFGSY